MNLIRILATMFFGINIQVFNHSSAQVETLQVVVGGESFEAKNILPGGVCSWRFKPRKDGSFDVNGHFVNGKSIHGQALGYTTVNDSFDHQLIIYEDGNVTYQIIESK